MILGLAADNKSITLLKTGEPSASYADFLAELPADDCRYAVLKFDYDAGTDGARSKIVFFMWYVVSSVSFFFLSLQFFFSPAGFFFSLAAPRNSTAFCPPNGLLARETHCDWTVWSW